MNIAKKETSQHRWEGKGAKGQGKALALGKSRNRVKRGKNDSMNLMWRGRHLKEFTHGSIFFFKLELAIS